MTGLCYGMTERPNVDMVDIGEDLFLESLTGVDIDRVLTVSNFKEAGFVCNLCSCDIIWLGGGWSWVGCRFKDVPS